MQLLHVTALEDDFSHMRRYFVMIDLTTIASILNTQTCCMCMKKFPPWMCAQGGEIRCLLPGSSRLLCEGDNFCHPFQRYRPWNACWRTRNSFLLGSGCGTHQVPTVTANLQFKNVGIVSSHNSPHTVHEQVSIYTYFQVTTPLFDFTPRLWLCLRSCFNNTVAPKPSGILTFPLLSSANTTEHDPSRFHRTVPYAWSFFCLWAHSLSCFSSACYAIHNAMCRTILNCSFHRG